MANEEKEIKITVKGEEKPRVVSEAEEVKEILEAVTPFLERLKDMAKEIIVTVAGSLDGKKLGEEVASLYKELKSQGLPDDLINDLVKEFYRKKLEMAPSISEVLKSITEAFKGKKAKVIVEEEKRGEEEEEKEEKEK